MLKQLSRLSIETDGRYATDAELAFIKDYLATVDQRISAYEKIRNAEQEIVTEVGETSCAIAPQLFPKSDEKFISFCDRDRRSVLRISAASMLLGERDALLNGFLCWYQTIVKCFKYRPNAKITYDLMPKVINKHLSEDESKFMNPIMALNRSILAD